MINYLKFYRLISYGQKIAWIRSLAYVFLGYAVSGHFNFVLMLINMLLIIAICMSAFSLNDLVDYKKGGDQNYIGELIDSGVKEHVILCYIFLPLVMLFGLFLLKVTCIFFLCAFLFVSLLYSMPGIMLKQKCGFFCSPLCAVFGFLEAVLLLGSWNYNVAFLSICIFLFHCYAESIHVLEECQTKERVSLKDKEVAYLGLRTIPFITAIISILFSFHNVAFILGAIFSLVRIETLKKVDPDFNFYQLHRNMFSNIYSSFEFAGYAILGVFGCFT